MRQQVLACAAAIIAGVSADSFNKDITQNQYYFDKFKPSGNGCSAKCNAVRKSYEGKTVSGRESFQKAIRVMRECLDASGDKCYMACEVDMRIGYEGFCDRSGYFFSVYIPEFRRWRIDGEIDIKRLSGKVKDAFTPSSGTCKQQQLNEQLLDGCSGNGVGISHEMATSTYSIMDGDDYSFSKRYVQGNSLVFKPLDSRCKTSYDNTYFFETEFEKDWYKGDFSGDDDGDNDGDFVQSTEAPVTEQKTTKAEITDAPVTEAPVTEQKTTEAEITDAPVTEQKTTEATITEAPTTEQETTAKPQAGGSSTELRCGPSQTRVYIDMASSAAECSDQPACAEFVEHSMKIVDETTFLLARKLQQDCASTMKGCRALMRATAYFAKGDVCHKKGEQHFMLDTSIFKSFTIRGNLTLGTKGESEACEELLMASVPLVPGAEFSCFDSVPRTRAGVLTAIVSRNAGTDNQYTVVSEGPVQVADALFFAPSNSNCDLDVRRAREHIITFEAAVVGA